MLLDSLQRSTHAGKVTQQADKFVKTEALSTLSEDFRIEENIVEHHLPLLPHSTEPVGELHLGVVHLDVVHLEEVVQK